MCLKSYFKEIILKLATNGQSDKGFLLTSTFVQGVVCPCPGAIYMYKSIQIYTRTRCQVSVYRTTGPLVQILGELQQQFQVSQYLQFWGNYVLQPLRRAWQKHWPLIRLLKTIEGPNISYEGKPISSTSTESLWNVTYIVLLFMSMNYTWI